MRAVVQRVTRAEVTVGKELISRISHGLCVLVGAMNGDNETDVAFMARKLSTLRIFPDSEGRMNLSVQDAGGAILLVSQFTLAADTTSGTRPSFTAALPPEQAKPLLEMLATQLRTKGIEVGTGEFGAKMELALVNDGPVTIMLDSRDKRKK